MAQAKNHWEKIRNNKDAKQSASFLLGFVLAFSVLYITSLLLLYPIELLFAFMLQGFYSLLGVPGEIIFQEPVLILFPKLSVQISFLCTGLMELMVIIAAILASFGIAMEKKWKGILAATGTVLVFNSLRIIITSLLIQNTSAAAADLAHDFLFRISLFIIIVGFYGLWFYWATGKLGKKVLKRKG